MKHVCDFLDFRSSAFVVYVPLGCGAVSRSYYYTTFHDHVLALSSTVHMFIRNCNHSVTRHHIPEERVPYCTLINEEVQKYILTQIIKLHK